MSSIASDISEEIGSDDWMLLTYIHDRKEGEAFEDVYESGEDEDSIEDLEDNVKLVVIHMTRTDEDQEEPKNYKNFYKILEDDDGHCDIVYMVTSDDEDDGHYKNDYLSMSSIGKLTGYETHEKYEDFALVYESLSQCKGQCKGFAEAYKRDCSEARHCN